MNKLEGEKKDYFPFSTDVESSSAIEVMRLQVIYFSIMEIPSLLKKNKINWIVVKYYFYVGGISRNPIFPHLSR